MVTKAEFLFMIQSVNLPPSAHTITSSAHCSTLQPSAACSQPVHIQCTYTAAAITSLEHTAANLQCTLQPCTAMYSYLQPAFSAHCSQLQPSTIIYTAPILSSAHCSYTTQCTLQLHSLVLIPYSASSAPLDHHRVSL